VPCRGGRLIMSAGSGGGAAVARRGGSSFALWPAKVWYLLIGGSFGRRVKEMEAREHAEVGLPRSEPLPWRPSRGQSLV